MIGETPSERKAAETSLGELVGEVTRDMSTLLRQELELAKAELRQSAATAGKASIALSIGVYAGLMAVFFLTVGFWWALGQAIGLGWSALVTAVIWAVIAAVLIVIGRNKIKQVEGAPQTVDTLKEIPEALKRNEENR